MHLFVLYNSNGLFACFSKCPIHRIRLKQNAVSCILAGTKRYEHITQSLQPLHWLPKEARIIFKVLLLVYKPK